MKIRNSFVSNSSSASFLINKNDITKEQEQELNKLIIDWFSKNACQQTFFTVEKSEQITLEQFYKEQSN